MTHSEIERWALRVVEQVKRGQPNEDARVELKAVWPDEVYKAARQIAAHANPAGGEPILWLIGVDQKGVVVGADHKELAKWYKQVESQFDDIAPGVTDVNVPVEGKIIVALLFDTRRRPFVIRSLNSGSVTHEVPWRGATSTRSAKREELVRLLDSVPRLPKLEAVNGTLSVEWADNPRMRGNNRRWLLNLKLYVEPDGPGRISVPFHRCAGSLLFEGAGWHPQIRNIRMAPYDQQTSSIRGSSTDLVIDGPGMVTLDAEGETMWQGELPHIPAHLSVELPVAGGGGYPVTVQAFFTFNDATDRWEFGDLSGESSGVHV
jgi:hypothetical protein